MRLKDYSTRELVRELEDLKSKVEKIPENFKDDDGDEKSFLDCVLEEGIFPTYSFPRNIVGFHIENFKGDKIEQKPDRSIDIALSEYAPGRIVVVNKKSYKSGGIYNFHSKFISGYYDKPAAKYIGSKDFFKSLYKCTDNKCTWVGYQIPKDNKCPFCNNPITSKNIVKPWGFAPINGVSIKEAEAESENSYATTPVYSLPLDESKLNNIKNLSLIKYIKLSDQPLTIINSGTNDEGFLLCKLCGASVPGNKYEDLKAVGKPFRHPYSEKRCFHPENECENVFLGHQLYTDMVVYQIKLDSNILDTSPRNTWLLSAVQTLAEAFSLSAGRLLDVEFTDIKNGFRIRQSDDCVYADIYLFDNLSSGAGYSTTIAERSAELLEETRKTLSECKSNCDTACQDCLKHFWNQNVKYPLNRMLGLDLLNWIVSGLTPHEFTAEEQNDIFRPLAELLKNNHNITTNSVISIDENNVYIYPCMWNINDPRVPKGTIALSDRLINHSLPEAYRQLSNQL